MKKILKILFIPFLVIIILSCEKETGPFESNVIIIKNFNANIYSDSCYWNDFFIDLSFQGVTVFEGKFSQPPFNKSSCIFIKKINIYTINDYNNKYKANSNVSEIFDIYLVSIYFLDANKEFKNLTSTNDDLFWKSVKNVHKDFFCSPFYFKLNSPPSNDGEQRFIIEIDNGAGDIIRDTTEVVYLKVN